MPKVALSYNSGFLIILLISRLMTIIGVKQRLCTNNLPSELFSLDIANKLSFDNPSISMASVDFGMLVHAKPAAIFRPTSVHDIVSLLKFSYNSSIPFKIAARGRGHSCRGQAMVENGVVIDMTSLKSFLNNNINNNNNYDDNNNNNIINTNDNDNNFDNNNNIDNDSNFNNNNNNNNNFNNGGIRVSYDATLGYYVDVGGGQLWIDVLQSTLEHGVAPVAWTDYLYLSVGGTLSNAGISGQAFRYGPQISNVYELDVVTGKGELITCSKKKNQELFYAALGGLGQFGIITRARIKLEVAPKRVKWVRMLYDNFETFTKDQEHLISSYGYEQEETLSGGKFDGLNYVEGSLMHQFSPNNWRSSFFTPTDQTKITSLNTTNGILYCLEVAKYYYEDTNNVDIDKELERKLQGLDLIQGFMFQKEVSFVEFLNRVRKGEMELQSTGQWDVPHPWLNIFVPRSQINHLAQVFTNVATKNSKVLGPILIYPLNKNKWDDNMSAATPEEDVFYTIGVLHSSGFDDWQALEDKNKELLNYCDEHGIKIKQYLPHYSTTQEWRAHFGSKWGKFKDRKALFDPKMILSPGQKVFASM